MKIVEYSELEYGQWYLEYGRYRVITIFKPTSFFQNYGGHWHNAMKFYVCLLDFNIHCGEDLDWYIRPPEYGEIYYKLTEEEVMRHVLLEQI